MDKDTIKLQRISALLTPLGCRIVKVEKLPTGVVQVTIEFKSEEEAATPVAAPS